MKSVFLSRLSNENYEMINDRLAEALNRFEEDLLAGAIISVSDEAFRVRHWPI